MENDNFNPEEAMEAAVDKRKFFIRRLLKGYKLTILMKRMMMMKRMMVMLRLDFNRIEVMYSNSILARKNIPVLRHSM